MFERNVDETFDSLPETAPIEPGRTPPDFFDKLKAIAVQEGFEAERLLGKGGMGAVVLALDKNLGRRVAIKFLVRQHSLSSDRLRREAEKAGSLAHENIIQVYSWHAVGEITFFSMEYVEGETLEEYVNARPKMKPIEALRIMAEAAAGVAAAHAQGILHRDIKPQNILISKEGRVKVGDFGLSSTVDEAGQSSGASWVSGTIGFMAPEQARGEEEKLATDTYSLTATLYYALTRRMPFEKSENGQDILENNRQGKIVPLFTARKGLPQPIYKFVARGLSKEQSRRYSDAGVFRKELEQVMLQLNMPAYRPPVFQRIATRPGLGFKTGFLLGAIFGIAIAAAAVILLGLS